MCRSRVPALVSATKERSDGKPSAVRERLFEYAVNKRGAMIAVYNGAQSCVIKIRTVANRIDQDWHFLLRPEVTAATQWRSKEGRRGGPPGRQSGGVGGKNVGDNGKTGGVRRRHQVSHDFLGRQNRSPRRVPIPTLRRCSHGRNFGQHPFGASSGTQNHSLYKSVMSDHRLSRTIFLLISIWPPVIMTNGHISTTRYPIHFMHSRPLYFVLEHYK